MNLGGTDLDSADDTRPASLVHELSAEALALDGAAAAAEHTAVRTGAAPAAAPLVVVDWKGEAHDLVDFSTGLFFPLYPRLASVWTPDRCSALEARLALVLQKYNLNMERLLGRWGPELMLAATIAPAVLPTVNAVRDDLRELREKRAEQERAAPPRGRTEAPPPAVRTDARTIDAAAGPASSAPPAPPDQARLHQAV